jgi:hypothetical protein
MTIANKNHVTFSVCIALCQGMTALHTLPIPPLFNNTKNIIKTHREILVLRTAVSGPATPCRFADSFNIEDGDGSFLRIVDTYLPNYTYTALHPVIPVYIAKLRFA